MPGAGKSYYGKLAAKKLGIPFIDLDNEIEKETKQSITQLFTDMGEKGFREIEYQCLLKLIHTITINSIIATGGGTPCFNNSLTLMKSYGKVLWLDADILTLMENLKGKNKLRPLLNSVQSDDLRQKLEQLQKVRLPFYTQCHEKVSVYRGLSPDLFTNWLHLSTFAKSA